MENPTFVSFISLEYEYEPPSALDEAADSMYGEPKKPQKEIDSMLPVHDIEEVCKHRVFTDLTEIRTYGQKIYIVDEHFKQFRKRLLDLTGQEAKPTWKDHASEDGLVKIRTYHN